jgi:hypothetical protein
VLSNFDCSVKIKTAYAKNSALRSSKHRFRGFSGEQQFLNRSPKPLGAQEVRPLKILLDTSFDHSLQIHYIVFM